MQQDITSQAMPHYDDPLDDGLSEQCARVRALLLSQADPLAEIDTMVSEMLRTEAQDALFS